MRFGAFLPMSAKCQKHFARSQLPLATLGEHQREFVRGACTSPTHQTCARCCSATRQQLSCSRWTRRAEGVRRRCSVAPWPTTLKTSPPCTTHPPAFSSEGVCFSFYWRVQRGCPVSNAPFLIFFSRIRQSELLCGPVAPDPVAVSRILSHRKCFESRFAEVTPTTNVQT